MLRELPIGLYLLLIFGIIVGNVFVYREIFASRMLAVTVFEVGEKGDAVLIQTPNRKMILIDTGPDASILRALGTTLPPWERRIDTVILTSEKTGATGGLADVMSRYRTPNPLRLGTSATPYGAHLVLDGASVTVLAPGLFTVSYGAASFSISSSTPPGTYVSDGKAMTRVAP